MHVSLRDVISLGIPDASASTSPRVDDLLVSFDLPVDGLRTVELVNLLQGTNRLTVGVLRDQAPTALLEACDVVVTSEAQRDAVRAAVDHSPLAAYALIHALRASAGLPAQDALTVESAAYSLLLGGQEFARWLAGRSPLAIAPLTRPVLRLRRERDVLEIMLTRPERRNAFGTELRDALVEAFELVRHDRSIRRVELRGEGPCFSSGGELAEFGTTPDTATAHFLRTSRSPARILVQISDRTTAFVHGPCIGAGVELPSLCCRVVATKDATFRLPEVAMGLIPGAGGTVGLTRRIGRRRTAWLALTGEEIDAETALEWGLVDRVHE
jgi:Enoyl-CoA hydratase/isomerase